jgi:hypothetical protein
MRSHPLVEPLTTEQILTDQNRLVISEALKARMQEMNDLADLIEGGTATAVDRTRALVLALRGERFLVRLQLQLLDATD